MQEYAAEWQGAMAQESPEAQRSRHLVHEDGEEDHEAEATLPAGLSFVSTDFGDE